MIGKKDICHFMVFSRHFPKPLYSCITLIKSRKLYWLWWLWILFFLYLSNILHWALSNIYTYLQLRFPSAKRCYYCRNFDSTFYLLIWGSSHLQLLSQHNSKLSKKANLHFLFLKITVALKVPKASQLPFHSK